jgi:hypothetical protein
MALIDTPVQRRMGVKDSPALALADWHSGRSPGQKPTSSRVPSVYTTGCGTKACALCQP